MAWHPALQRLLRNPHCDLSRYRYPVDILALNLHGVLQQPELSDAKFAGILWVILMFQFQNQSRFTYSMFIPQNLRFELIIIIGNFPCIVYVLYCESIIVVSLGAR